jgi:hypothetical protein
MQRPLGRLSTPDLVMSPHYQQPSTMGRGPTRHRRRFVLATGLAALLPLLIAAAPASAEQLAYRWSLRGFVGRMAGLVLPDEGRGELRTRQAGSGYVTELEITSPQSGKGEFFLYGSETRADGSTAEAWSAYRWRDKEKDKREQVDTLDVVDVAAGIRLIRDRQPQSSLRMRIWSDGRIYPVVVQRVATENVKVPAGAFRADHYRVRGLRISGERFWKGGLDLWLAQDEERTPVAIQVERGFANVRLELLPVGQASGGRR